MRQRKEKATYTRNFRNRRGQIEKQKRCVKGEEIEQPL